MNDFNRVLHVIGYSFFESLLLMDNLRYIPESVQNIIKGLEGHPLYPCLRSWKGNNKLYAILADALRKGFKADRLSELVYYEPGTFICIGEAIRTAVLYGLEHAEEITQECNTIISCGMKIQKNPKEIEFFEEDWYYLVSQIFHMEIHLFSEFEGHKIIHKKYCQSHRITKPIFLLKLENSNYFQLYDQTYQKEIPQEKLKDIGLLEIQPSKIINSVESPELIKKIKELEEQLKQKTNDLAMSQEIVEKLEYELKQAKNLAEKQKNEELQNIEGRHKQEIERMQNELTQKYEEIKKGCEEKERQYKGEIENYHSQKAEIEKHAYVESTKKEEIIKNFEEKEKILKKEHEEKIKEKDEEIKSNEQKFKSESLDQQRMINELKEKLLGCQCNSIRKYQHENCGKSTSEKLIDQYL